MEYFFKPMVDRYHELNEYQLDNFWPIVTQSIYNGILDDIEGLKRNYLRKILELRNYFYGWC